MMGSDLTVMVFLTHRPNETLQVHTILDFWLLRWRLKEFCCIAWQNMPFNSQRCCICATLFECALLRLSRQSPSYRQSLRCSRKILCPRLLHCRLTSWHTTTHLMEQAVQRTFTNGSKTETCTLPSKARIAKYLDLTQPLS